MTEPIVQPTPIRQIPDANWLALTALTETDQPREWPLICQVILNRKRSGHYPSDMYLLVREKEQFSAFNSFQHIAEEAVLYSALMTDKDPARVEWDTCLSCAEAMLALPIGCSILPPNTTLYWSPRSMPDGDLPPWNWKVVYVFGFPGIQRSRFTFAEERPDPTLAGHAESADIVAFP